MKIEKIPLKSKTWGVVLHPDRPGHFYTGYAGRWNDYATPGSPEESMAIGCNVLITGAFRIEDMHRGMSAANFKGYFKDHWEVTYIMSMDGLLKTIQALQDGIAFKIVEGYIEGVWTIAKKGANIFLHPAV